MKAVNITKSIIVSEEVEIADSFFKRLLGLMGRHKIPGSHSLFICPCNSIHTCFMRFPIDVLFIDKTGMVLKKIENCRPWKLHGPVKGAAGVLEFAAGSPHITRTTPGDTIKIF